MWRSHRRCSQGAGSRRPGCWIKEDRMFRNGIGWDVHPLVAGRSLVLGGVRFADAKQGLLGHSDADVVCHAVCDALLGALALGDIGDLFPDSESEYKGYDSTRFLEIVRDRIGENGYEIVNVDCTVMSDAVRLGAKKREMETVMAKHLGVAAGNVSVKATTWEGHGAVGRGEVIACQAIATVRKV
jgi:2-C-methyl-D-erythritol 2,4-cyclodiphosphate synthase